MDTNYRLKHDIESLIANHKDEEYRSKAWLEAHKDSLPWKGSINKLSKHEMEARMTESHDYHHDAVHQLKHALRVLAEHGLV